MKTNMPDASDIKSTSDVARNNQKHRAPSGSHERPITVTDSPMGAGAAVTDIPATATKDSSGRPGAQPPQPAHHTPIQTDMFAPETMPRGLRGEDTALPAAHGASLGRSAAQPQRRQPPRGAKPGSSSVSSRTTSAAAAGTAARKTSAAAKNGHSGSSSAPILTASGPSVPVAPKDSTLPDNDGAHVAAQQPVETGPNTVSGPHLPGNGPSTHPPQEVIPALKPNKAAAPNNAPAETPAQLLTQPSVKDLSDEISQLRRSVELLGNNQRNVAEEYNKILRQYISETRSMAEAATSTVTRNTEPDMSPYTTELEELTAQVDGLVTNSGVLRMRVDRLEKGGQITEPGSRATDWTTLTHQVKNLEKEGKVTKVKTTATSLTLTNLTGRVNLLEKSDQITKLKSLATNLTTLTDRVKNLENQDPTKKVGQLDSYLNILIDRVNQLEDSIFPCPEPQQEPAALQNNKSPALAKPGGQATNRQNAEKGLNGKQGGLETRLESAKQASPRDRGRPAAREGEEHIVVGDSSTEPSPKKRKRAETEPAAHVRSQSEALPATARRMSRTQVRLASTATQTDDVPQARSTHDTNGPMTTARGGAAPAAAPEQSAADAAPNPAPPVGDELVDFLIEMDCREVNDLKKLQAHLVPLREFLLYEGDVIPSFTAAGGRGTLVLRVGGLAGADARPAPRECLQNSLGGEEPQPNDDKEKVAHLGVVELRKMRKDKNPSAVRLPRYAVYLGEVFQTYILENSRRIKTETTGYDVFMDVRNPRKALWAVYRRHEYYPGRAGMKEVRFESPIVPFYKGVEKSKPWDSFQLLKAVSDWQKPREQAMYGEGRGADLLKATSMIWIPVVLVAHYENWREATDKGWSKKSKASTEG